MDEKSAKYPKVEWVDPWKPPPPARWHKIISNSIFLGLFLTSPGWSEYADKLSIAMVCLMVALVIRYYDVEWD
jgi:hypothetical protein